MNLKLERHSSVPLGEQIQTQIRVLIITGALAPNDLLPTVQTLAETTQTNYNTAAAAYRALEAQGYLVQRRRAGTRVAAEPPIGVQEVLAVHLGAEVAERLNALGLAASDTLQLIGAQAALEAGVKVRPLVAALAGDVLQAVSLAERAKALFKELTFVPVTLEAYQSQVFVATLIHPHLLRSLQNVEQTIKNTEPTRPPYTPVWPSAYDFPAGAD